MTAKQPRPRTILASIRPPLLKIYLTQCVVVAVASLTVFPFDRVASYSLLLGGMISIVPSAYFARQVFRYSGALRAREVAQGFYRGEVGKFIAVTCFFAIAFAVVKPLEAWVMLASFAVTTLLNIGLLAGTKRKSRPNSENCRE